MKKYIDYRTRGTTKFNWYRKNTMEAAMGLYGIKVVEQLQKLLCETEEEWENKATHIMESERLRMEEVW